MRNELTHEADDRQRPRCDRDVQKDAGNDQQKRRIEGVRQPEGAYGVHAQREDETIGESVSLRSRRLRREVLVVPSSLLTLISHEFLIRQLPFRHTQAAS